MRASWVRAWRQWSGRAWTCSGFASELGETWTIGLSSNPIGLAGIARDEPATSALTAPLVHGEEQIGEIDCGLKRGGAFSTQDQDLLTAIGRQAALAIRSATLTTELAERLAQIQLQAGELAASRTRSISPPAEFATLCGAAIGRGDGWPIHQASSQAGGSWMTRIYHRRGRGFLFRRMPNTSTAAATVGT